MQYLIDASVYVFRAYYSMPDDMVDAEGNPVNALYGYCRFLGDFIEQVNPEHVAVAFDESLTTSFRTSIYPEYKANRDAQPEDLSSQIPLIRELVDAYHFPVLEVAGFEADDVIATLVDRAPEGAQVTIVSTDRDLMQLVDERVTLADGVFHQAVFTAAEPVFVVPEQSSAGIVALDYARLGAEHIWAGPDHLLFVMGLLLLVGWNRRLVYTVTAFTVGHSVTLAMVTLGLFDYPVTLVEFMIALSIYVLAVELAKGQAGGTLWRQPWWLAGGFGLLHGMGFAGALAETGLPQSNVPLALLFFNVGIELGQLAFIAVLVLAASVLSRAAGSVVSKLRPVPVYALGGLSAMWCIERGLGTIA